MAAKGSTPARTGTGLLNPTLTAGAPEAATEKRSRMEKPKSRGKAPEQAGARIELCLQERAVQHQQGRARRRGRGRGP
eukprot:15018553-Alexandrium_andersonii.AAC.1